MFQIPVKFATGTTSPQVATAAAFARRRWAAAAATGRPPAAGRRPQAAGLCLCRRPVPVRCLCRCRCLCPCPSHGVRARGRSLYPCDIGPCDAGRRPQAARQHGQVAVSAQRWAGRIRRRRPSDSATRLGDTTTRLGVPTRRLGGQRGKTSHRGGGLADAAVLSVRPTRAPPPLPLPTHTRVPFSASGCGEAADSRPLARLSPASRPPLTRVSPASPLAPHHPPSPP